MLQLQCTEHIFCCLLRDTVSVVFWFNFRIHGSAFMANSQSTLKRTPAQTILQRQVCKIYTVHCFPSSCCSQSTYIYTVYRAGSGVFRTTVLNPHPLSTQRVCPTTAPKAGGYTLAGRWGGGGSIFRKTPDIGLASYSTIPLRCSCSFIQNCRCDSPRAFDLLRNPEFCTVRNLHRHHVDTSSNERSTNFGGAWVHPVRSFAINKYQIEQSANVTAKNLVFQTRRLPQGCDCHFYSAHSMENFLKQNHISKKSVRWKKLRVWNRLKYLGMGLRPYSTGHYFVFVRRPPWKLRRFFLLPGIWRNLELNKNKTKSHDQSKKSKAKAINDPNTIQIWPDGPFKLILCFALFSFVINDEKYFTFSCFARQLCCS